MTILIGWSVRRLEGSNVEEDRKSRSLTFVRDDTSEGKRRGEKAESRSRSRKQKAEGRKQKAESRKQKAESRSLTTVRKRRDRVPFGCAQGRRDDTSEGKEQRGEGRKQRAESRKRKAEGRRQKAEGRRKETEGERNGVTRKVQKIASCGRVP